MVLPLLGAALIGGIASFAGSKSASSAAKKSAAASQAAADAATAEQRRQYDLTRSDQMPWMETGRGALDVLAKQYGIGQTQSDQFTASPDYQFRQDEQTRGLNAYLSKIGARDSGAAYTAALEKSGNLASAEYGNWYNRLANLAGVGQATATNLGQVGQNYAGQVGQIAQNNAANLSSSYGQRAAAQQGLYRDLAGIGTTFIQKAWPV